MQPIRYEKLKRCCFAVRLTADHGSHPAVGEAMPPDMDEISSVNRHDILALRKYTEY